MKKSILILLAIYTVNLFSQSFSVLNIDASNFPFVKAGFFANGKDGKQILNFSPNDFVVKENGVKRNVVGITCPPPNISTAISAVLVIDVSLSMDDKRLHLAIEAAKAWIDGITDPRSECAITSFSDNNYLIQEFTTDKQRLKDAMSKLKTYDGTNYDAGLLNWNAGGIWIAKKGRYKRVIVFLTDGQPNFPPDESAIITQANKFNIAIYCVTVNMPMPDCLINIAKNTGGSTYSEITSSEQAVNIYRSILKTVQVQQPCTIEWQSAPGCELNGRDVEISCLPLAKTAGLYYLPPQSSIATLEAEPATGYFKNIPVGKRKDTVIKITALNGAIRVINIKTDNPAFDINPKSFFLGNGESKQLTISCTPADSIYTFATYNVETDNCPFELYFSCHYTRYKPSEPSLKITHPNGGEVFVAGSDTLITWEGLPKPDTVILEYSYDEGKTWTKITDTVTGLVYKWKNVPKPASKKCLARVTQNTSSLEYLKIPKDTLIFFSDTAVGINNNSVYRLILCKDDSTVIMGMISGDIIIYNLAKSKIIKRFKAHNTILEAITLNNDESRLLTSGFDKKAILWNTQTWDSMQVFEHKSNVKAFCFIPNSNLLVTGCSDNKTILWDGSSGEFVREFAGHSAEINDFDISPDSKYLVTCSNDKTAIIWDIGSGNEIMKFKGHTDYIQNVVFSLDGKSILTGSYDNTARLWDVGSGNCKTIFFNDEGMIGNIEICPDGSTMNMDIFDNYSMYTLKVWDLVTGEVISRIDYSFDWPSAKDFNSDGSKILFGFDANHLIMSKIIDSIRQSDVSDSLFEIVSPEVSSMDIDMGKVLVNSSKDSVIKNYIFNTGTFRNRIDSIKFEGADTDAFSLVSGIPPYTLEAGSGCDVEFSFMPARAGIHKADIVISYGPVKLIQKIRGEGVPPKIEIIGEIIDFGIVKVGNYKDTVNAATIKNISSVPIEITSTKHNLPNDKDFTTLSGGGSFTIQPNKTALMDLRFEPADSGMTSGTLEFYYNDIGSPAVIQLYGTGLEYYSEIQSGLASFRNIICNNMTNSELILSNKGASNLIINSMSITGADAGDFSADVSLPVIIEPDSAKKIPVSFVPSSSGQKYANLEIKSNSIRDSLLIIPLLAKKDSIALEPAEKVIDLGILCPKEKKDTVIVVYNKGTLPAGAYIESSGLITTVKEFSIKPSDSLFINFSFSGAPDDGKISENIAIYDSTCGWKDEVVITGEIAMPKLLAQNITITSVKGYSNEGKLVIKNVSNRDCNLSSVSNVQSPFSILGNLFPLKIPANEQAEIKISYFAEDLITDSIMLEFDVAPCSVNAYAKIIGLPVAAEVTLMIPDISAYPGDIKEIPILIRNTSYLVESGVTGFDTKLGFNTTLLAPIDYDVFPTGSNTGYIELNGISVNNIQGETLLSVKFKAGLGDSKECRLMLSDAVTLGGQMNITLESGAFHLLGICPEGGDRLIKPNSNSKILSIKPNPSYDAVGIELELAESGYKKLYVCDILGREKILIMENANNEYGIKNLDLDISFLESGVYYVILKTATVNQSMLMLIRD